MAEHHLKTWPEYFQPLVDGQKTVELRHDDRKFREGDVLILQEWIPPHLVSVDADGVWPVDGLYTGRQCRRVVTHVLHDLQGKWLQPGVVALSLREATDDGE